MPARKYRPKPRDEIRRNMSAIRSTGNRSEVALRKYLHRLGYRYRIQPRYLPGTPDLVFPRHKLVVFVDGDFWHARVLREGGVPALRQKLRTKNRGYWMEKFKKRILRDDTVTAGLEDDGWTVFRCWESDVIADLPGVAQRIVALLEHRHR